MIKSESGNFFFDSWNTRSAGHQIVRQSNYSLHNVDVPPLVPDLSLSQSWRTPARLRRTRPRVSWRGPGPGPVGWAASLCSCRSRDQTGRRLTRPQRRRLTSGRPAPGSGRTYRTNTPGHTSRAGVCGCKVRSRSAVPQGTPPPKEEG